MYIYIYIYANTGARICLEYRGPYLEMRYGPPYPEIRAPVSDLEIRAPVYGGVTPYTSPRVTIQGYTGARMLHEPRIRGHPPYTGCIRGSCVPSAKSSDRRASCAPLARRWLTAGSSRRRALRHIGAGASYLPQASQHPSTMLPLLQNNPEPTSKQTRTPSRDQMCRHCKTLTHGGTSLTQEQDVP